MCRRRPRPLPGLRRGGGGEPASEGVGGESAGSALGDANREGYVARGMDPGEAVSLDWAGDVGVELSPDFFGAERTPFVFYGVTVP